MKTACVVFLSWAVLATLLTTGNAATTTATQDQLALDDSSVEQDLQKERAAGVNTAALLTGGAAADSSVRRELRKKIKFVNIQPQDSRESTQHSQTFSAKVTDSGNVKIKKVELFYKLPGETNFEKTKLQSGSNNVWSRTINNIPAGRVDWYLKAKNKKGATRKTSEASFDIVEEQPPPPPPPQEPDTPPENPQEPAPPPEEPQTPPENPPPEEPQTEPETPLGPFSQISPLPGLQGTEHSQTFSAEVVDIDNGQKIKEVKLRYNKPGASGFKSKAQLQYTGSNNIWSLQINNLSSGTYTWKLRAKTKKNKIMWGDISSFTITAPETPEEETSSITHGLQASCHIRNTNRYDICLDLVSVSGKVESWMQAFMDAKVDWEKVITGHTDSWSADYFYYYGVVETNVPSTVDDIYIVGKEAVIDGQGSVLGWAGPTLYNPSTGIPFSGHMEFDEDDIAWLQEDKIWMDVIKHEMGHVLGIGTLWDVEEKNSQFEYTGAKGIDVWTDICPSSDYGSPPVEHDGSVGTAGHHWDEYCFDNMMMTGWVNSGNNPLSVLTVAALEDIGYEVSYDMATDEDLLSSPCCNSRRNLRHAGRNLHADNNIFDHNRELRPLKKNSGNKMSAGLYEHCADEAAKKLKYLRANAPSPSSLPEGVAYAAGDMISVVAIDEDGGVKEATFTYVEVRDRIRD